MSAHAAQAHAVCVCSVRARRPRRGPAPCRGVTPGSGAPGSGQLIVEFAAAGNVKALTRLLEIEYAVPDDELDSSTRAIRTAQVRTAAQRAAHAGMVYTLRLLLEYGADLGLEQGNGRAIACEAAARGHREVLKLLLAPHDPPESIGGNVSTTLQNGHGRTVLMEAAMQGHAECLKVVIEAGADLDFATKNYNATAAHFAARDSHLECLNILRDAGADMEIERTDGKTAMQIHRENVRTQMTNTMLRSAPKKSDSGFKV